VIGRDRRCLYRHASQMPRHCKALRAVRDLIDNGIVRNALVWVIILVGCADHGSNTPTLVAIGPTFAPTAVGNFLEGFIDLTNTGEVTTGPISLSIDGPAAAEYIAVDNAPAIEPDHTFELSVVFRPTARGARDATLTIEARPGGPLAIDLGGAGVMRDLRFEPASVTFDAPPGGRAEFPIELRNADTEPAPITRISSEGEVIVDSTCGAQLAAGAACEIVIIAEPPISSGTLHGTVLVESIDAMFRADVTVVIAIR
jgi:hypothetical protein